MSFKTVAKDILTLRGSTAIANEAYPEESSVKVKKYGLPMLLAQDEGVNCFIANLNAQLPEWLEAGKLERVVIVITSKATNILLSCFC
ncbi:plant mitotic spindle assembly checkpoint protein mad2, putative [Ricinus communis]|uniref:Plant mitotic spindle assembly checkpoint protein mad2, putative n=1 Tax=Ricinus communis TaxID=3988 RepID=B9T1E2_RICCO|nr:plant mitotic spindle assembly checkpoint protein mad2, putative [Ricinus communis]